MRIRRVNFRDHCGLCDSHHVRIVRLLIHDDGQVQQVCEDSWPRLLAGAFGTRARVSVIGLDRGYGKPPRWSVFRSDGYWWSDRRRWLVATEENVRRTSRYRSEGAAERARTRAEHRWLIDVCEALGRKERA